MSIQEQPKPTSIQKRLKRYIAGEGTSPKSDGIKDDEKDEETRPYATDRFDSLVEIYENLQRKLLEDQKLARIISRTSMAKFARKIYLIHVKREMRFHKWTDDEAKAMFPDVPFEDLTETIDDIINSDIGKKNTLIGQKRKEIDSLFNDRATLKKHQIGPRLRKLVTEVADLYVDTFNVGGVSDFAKYIYNKMVGVDSTRLEDAQLEDDMEELRNAFVSDLLINDINAKKQKQLQPEQTQEELQLEQKQEEVARLQQQLEELQQRLGEQKRSI